MNLIKQTMSSEVDSRKFLSELSDEKKVRFYEFLN